MNDLIDDQELQRLLDGVLPDEDRTLLLQYADDHPDNWRRIAMAFIEEQLLEDQLKQLVEHQRFPPEDAVKTDTVLHLWTRMWVQAAALCLILAAAVWLGRMSVEQRNTQVDGDQSAGDYTIVLSPELPSSAGDRNRLVNSEPESSQDEVERMLTPLFDQQSQGFFRDHGYTVNEEPVIYVVQGQQGEQYVVPHRNVSFVAHRP